MKKYVAMLLSLLFLAVFCKISSAAYVTCARCYGSGKMSCPMCNGSGICPICHGTGHGMYVPDYGVGGGLLRRLWRMPW